MAREATSEMDLSPAPRVLFALEPFATREKDAGVIMGMDAGTKRWVGWVEEGREQFEVRRRVSGGWVGLRVEGGRGGRGS